MHNEKSNEILVYIKSLYQMLEVVSRAPTVRVLEILPGGGVFYETITHKFHGLNVQNRETIFYRGRERSSSLACLERREEILLYNLFSSTFL